MEVYDESLDKFFPSIKIVGIGASGADALDYFRDVADDIFPARLIISEKDGVAEARAEILNFIDGCEWLFVITDSEDLGLAETFVKSIEGSKLLMTFLILCPSADDDRLADIPANFGTRIVLPKDKIAEIGLPVDEAIYRTVDMATGIIPIMKKRDNLIGMDFAEILRTMGNVGRAYVGFGAENNSLAAVKKALQSPLLIEDIRGAKTVWFVFFGKVDFINMMEINDAIDFSADNRHPECDILCQVDIDENFADGVAAFILATNFD